MIRVVVIDDQWIIATGLKSMFRPARDGIEITRICCSVESLIENSGEKGFDIIILDLLLNRFSPKENFTKLKEHFPGIPVMVYTGVEDPVVKENMINDGVAGYMSKGANKEEIKREIERICLEKN